MKTARQVIAKAFSDFEGEEAPVLLSSEAVEELIKALDAAGYVIVPKEPTEQMVNAAWGADVVDRGVSAIYTAMVEAAQKSPA